MNKALVFLSTIFLCFHPFDADAMYMWYETKQVPISRLFTNLQQRLSVDTYSFELTYDLARLHAMAYSTNLASIEVTTNDYRPQFGHPASDSGVPRMVSPGPSATVRVEGLRHLTNAIHLYERAMMLLKKSTNDPQHVSWMVLPLELGHAWCLDQAGSRQEALAAYRKVLTLAWKQEVTGDFNFKEWVQDAWNAVKAGSNPLSSANRRRSLGPGVCFSEETIKYLLKLLDPVKDAKEVANLKDRQKTLKSMSRAITPIIMPLIASAALPDLVNPAAKVSFDLDGSGALRPWGWITTNAAWLVYDAEGQGRITSGLQMFGSVTFWIFWRDGYEALRSLDDNHDGVLRGPELHGLALWQDLNGNGVSETGEVRPVTDWGITAISCQGELDDGGMPWCPTGVTFGNGLARPTYDWIAPSRASEE